MVSHIFSLFLFPFLSHLPIHIWNIRADRYWKLLQKCQRFQMALKIFRGRHCWLLRTPPTSTQVEISVLLYREAPSLASTLCVWMWLASSVSLPFDWGTVPGTKGEHSPREQHLQPAGAENVTRYIPCCWVSLKGICLAGLWPTSTASMCYTLLLKQKIQGNQFCRKAGDWGTKPVCGSSCQPLGLQHRTIKLQHL